MVKNSGSCSFKAGVEAIWSVMHHSARLLFLITVSNPFNTATMFLITSWSCDAALTVGLQAVKLFIPGARYLPRTKARLSRVLHRPASPQRMCKPGLYRKNAELSGTAVVIQEGSPDQWWMRCPVQVKTYSSSPQPYTHLSGSQSTEKSFLALTK